MSAPITSRIIWDGVLIEITYHERRHKNPSFDHIELRIPDAQIIPLTETGYKSHFLPSGIVGQHGGYEGFVRAWLDHAAKSSDWKARKDAARQMSLF